jgi:hypothetical protein
MEKEIDPSLLTRDLAPAAVSPEEIEAAFDYRSHRGRIQKERM